MGGIDGQVSWVVQCAVKEGQLDAFKELMEEMVAGTSEEPGTLNYEWFISDDGSTVHIYEKYADSEATVKHVTGLHGEVGPPLHGLHRGDRLHDVRQPR